MCIAKCPVNNASRVYCLGYCCNNARPDSRHANCRRAMLSHTWASPSDDKLAVIKTKTVVHEDNNGALNSSTYPWFREQLKPNRIEVMKVETTEQLGDTFTKGLGREKFREMRLKLCGLTYSSTSPFESFCALKGVLTRSDLSHGMTWHIHE